MTARLPTRMLAVLAMVVPTLAPLNPSVIPVAPPTTPTVFAWALPAVVADVGSRGSKVVTIQRVVRTNPDGFYGPTTSVAVKVWQRSQALPATGVVDPPTWSKINAVWGAVPAVGNDISWPQCPKGMGTPEHHGFGLPMPTASAQFVVIGLTNGVGYAANPCLAGQVAWAKAAHLRTAAYAVTTFPTPGQLATHGVRGPYAGTSPASRLANAGFAQASFNVASMGKVGLVSPMIWVDVEPASTGLWTKDTAANKSVVDGVLRGYQAAGFKVGIYSYERGYRKILAATRYGLPEWRTAGPRGQKVARGICAGTSLQGGPAVLAQWWTPSVDHDMTCPSSDTPAVLSDYFHKY